MVRPGMPAPAYGVAPLRVKSLDVFVFRFPLATPVVTSFGTMTDRPAVLVRVSDEDGNCGWGEVWCNFPNVGAEHRANLICSVIAPMVVGRKIEHPLDAFAALTDATRILVIQTGESGPIAQCIAGVDIALWDLAARRTGHPLWRLLGGTSPKIPVYASGLNPQSPEVAAAKRRADGHVAFKLKVGFGGERDLSNLANLRKVLGDECQIMVDANQAWDADTAADMANRMSAFSLGWLEEPVPADTPWQVWKALARESPIPLAAGENLQGDAAFEAAIEAGALAVIQPDVAKWGGISGCLRIARQIVAAGLRYCPHYLGAGIGLRASAHLLAAVGGGGMLEVDANPNPMREQLAEPLHRVASGECVLESSPGLGDIPDPTADPQLSRWLVLRGSGKG